MGYQYSFVNFLGTHLNGDDKEPNQAGLDLPFSF